MAALWVQKTRAVYFRSPSGGSRLVHFLHSRKAEGAGYTGNCTEPKSSLATYPQKGHVILFSLNIMGLAWRRSGEERKSKGQNTFPQEATPSTRDNLNDPYSCHIAQRKEAHEND
jgi:hypothetical protein